MSIPPTSVPQAPRLTASQIAEFKREGFVIDAVNIGRLALAYVK